jgi:hypothetical protein
METDLPALVAYVRELRERAGDRAGGDKMAVQGENPAVQDFEAIDRQAAMYKIAHVAMGDLLGASEPPEGVEDKYPFNAPAWRDSLPKDWREDAEKIICYVYHNEKMPNLVEMGICQS